MKDKYRIGVVGLGYVGLPLSIAFAKKYKVTGYDINKARVDELKKLYDAKMINIIGEEIVSYRSKKYSDNEFFFDYEKKEIKANRKMGHLTIIQK